jgi:nitrogen regulatory protein PII
MRMVIAFVQPFMTDRVEEALHGITGLSGATFTDVKGFGRGRASDVPGSEVLLGTSPKVRVEVIVPDALERAVVLAIRDAARTGNRGDGKVFVLPVSRAVRIATGEEGETAI